MLFQENVELTLWGQLVLFGLMELEQHWTRYWLVAWLHQAIAWANIDISSIRMERNAFSAAMLLVSMPINVNKIFVYCHIILTFL